MNLREWKEIPGETYSFINLYFGSGGVTRRVRNFPKSVIFYFRVLTCFFIFKHEMTTNLYLKKGDFYILKALLEVQKTIKNPRFTALNVRIVKSVCIEHLRTIRNKKDRQLFLHRTCFKWDSQWNLDKIRIISN